MSVFAVKQFSDETIFMSNNNKIYRWMPIEICLKNFIRGLSFGRVSNYKDKTEFSAKYRKLQRKDVIKFLKRQNPKSFSTIAIWENAKKKSANLMLRMLEKRHNPEELRKALEERYYTCCFTKEFSKDFDWSDQSNDPKVCLVINRDSLRQEHKYLVQPVRYTAQRPILRLPDNLLPEVVHEIVFTKLKTYGKYNFEKEKEIRALFCKDILKCPEEAVLHDVEEGAYVYEKNLHEYLEAIFIPKEIQDLEVVKETKLKIEQELKASRDIEKQIRLCKEIDQLFKAAAVNQSLFSYLLDIRAGIINYHEGLRDIQQAYNELNVYQKHSTIKEMFDVLAKGVDVDARLEELAKTPKYANVELICEK